MFVAPSCWQEQVPAHKKGLQPINAKRSVQGYEDRAGDPLALFQDVLKGGLEKTVTHLIPAQGICSLSIDIYLLVGIIDPDALKALPIAMVSRQEFEGNFFFIIAISLLRIEPGHCIIGCEI